MIKLSNYSVKTQAENRIADILEHRAKVIDDFITQHMTYEIGWFRWKKTLTRTKEEAATYLQNGDDWLFIAYNRRLNHGARTISDLNSIIDMAEKNNGNVMDIDRETFRILWPEG